MDEHLYRCVKNIEIQSQAMMFALPQPGSPACDALNIPPGEEWKLGQLIDALIWMEKRAKAGATSVYMQGKE